MTALIVVAGVYGAMVALCAGFTGLFWYSPQLRHRWLIADDDRKEL